MDSTQRSPDSRTLGTARENIQATREITSRVTEAGRQLYMLHIDAAQQALTENTEQMKGFMQNTANLSNFLAQWTSICQAQMQRHAELMRHSFEVAARTMTEINRLSGNAASNTTAMLEANMEETGRDFIERRKTSQVINFPDRRLAKQTAQSAQGRNAGAQSGSEKKRHAA